VNPPGISIAAETPLWVDSSDSWHLTQQLDEYTHTIRALGGYWSARFTVGGNRHLMDDWLQDGLGRHIEVFDGSLTKIWEGFVDKILVSYGPLAVERGPLLDTANSVAINYSAITYDENDEPVVGTRETSDYEDDTDSQALWGIIPKILSTGGIQTTAAEAVRDSFLRENAAPETSKTWRSTSAGSETNVTVECLGYVHWMNWAFNDLTSGGYDADEKILAVLADTPNSTWLTYGTDHVDENTLDVESWENQNNLAWSVIKDTVAHGDTTNNRWIFGIYENRDAYYQAAPTTIEYQQRLSDTAVRLESVEGMEVYPWNILPGKWIIYPDFLIGQAAEQDLRDDPRAMFIEEVKFTAPDQLEMQGGKTGKLDAIIAKLGLRGIGA